MSTQTGQGFIRQLGRWDALAIGFGAMIGFGWVVLTGEWLVAAGTLGAVLAFVVGGVTGLSPESLFRAMRPFLLALLAALFVLTLFAVPV